MSKFRKCVVCGSTYKYCPNCSEYENIGRWHNLYCSENCRDINYLYREYKTKTKPLSYLTKTLKKCDLTNKDLFRKDIKGMIKHLNGVKRKKK